MALVLTVEQSFLWPLILNSPRLAATRCTLPLLWTRRICQQSSRRVRSESSNWKSGLKGFAYRIAGNALKKLPYFSEQPTNGTICETVTTPGHYD